MLNISWHLTVNDMIKKAFRILYNSIRFIGKNCFRNILAVDVTVRIEKSAKAVLQVGKTFRARKNVELNIRDRARLSIGKNVFMNSGCIVTARESITIGDNTIFGPNVIIYDHDHKTAGGKIMDHEFSTQGVTIGNNVWIGAGTIILKGSVIEDNCIIAAGSIVKGHIPAGSIYMQKREKTILPLQ